MTNSNFNKAINVQTPEGAQKIEEVLLPLIKNQNVNNDFGQLGSLAGFLYSSENNYSSLCTRGLLNGYQKDFGEELIKINNTIISKGGKKPTCFANASNYCISTQVADGSFICVGVGGKLGTTKCLSALTICK